MTDIDSMVDAAVAENVTSEPTETVESNDSQEVVEQTQTEENPSLEGDSQDIEFPKKAVNAIARRDKKINKLYAEKQEAIQKMEALEQRMAALEQPKQESPNADSFETYGEYLEALALSGANNQQQAPQESEQSFSKEDAIAEARQQMYVEQQQKKVATQATEAANKLSDYNHLMVENQDIIDSLPQETQLAFLNAENGALAFYALAKEGNLENLVHMNPQQAAMAVARADIQGAKYLEAKPVSKAPAPAKGVKGSSGRNEKTLNQKSADELMDWLNS